jgi:hypothetical protein
MLSELENQFSPTRAEPSTRGEKKRRFPINRLNISAKTILIALAGVCVAYTARAWLRRSYTEAEVVSRAELIVVGKGKPGSIVFVPHTTSPSGGSWEHHVELEISEVLKGSTSSNSMTVSIHYGLEPIVSNRFEFRDMRGGSTNYPEGAIEIFDTAGFPRQQVSGDIRTSQIWLLHHVERPVHGDSDMIGIVDPEDLQPLAKKAELLKHLK